MAGRWATITQSDFEARAKGYLTAETVSEEDCIWLANAVISKPELQRSLRQIYVETTKTVKLGNAMRVYDRMSSVLVKIHDSRAQLAGASQK